MKLISPDYYTSFSCIAHRCRHSCCIGWEIDIDPETAAYYNSVGGKLGEKLQSCIESSDGDAHFILSKDEHCPFLCTDGLCEIIKEAGEKALCNICTDHPKFRSFFLNAPKSGSDFAAKKQHASFCRETNLCL